MWVKTIVLTRPMRLASHAAPRCETALATRAPKNSTPTDSHADAEALEEEVREERGGEEAAGQAVDGEQRRDPPEDAAALREIDTLAWPAVPPLRGESRE